MAPGTVAKPGIALELPFVLVAVVALAIQLDVEIALPDQVLHQRSRRHHLANTGQRDGMAAAIDDPHHALARRLQGSATLPGYALLLDQQGFVGTDGVDILPIDQHLAGITGLQRQLAAVHQHDLAGQAVAVVQPYGVGQRGAGQEHHDD